MKVYFSLDGGKTWKLLLLRGVEWPTEAGAPSRTVLRYTLPANQYSKSMMVKVEGSNQKREGIRKILAFGVPTKQEGPSP